MKFWPALLLGVVFAGCGSEAAPAPTPQRPGAEDRSARHAGAEAEPVRRDGAAPAGGRAAPAGPDRRRAALDDGRGGAARRAADGADHARSRRRAPRREWADANRTLAGLTGVRRTELGYVVQSIRSLAAQHALTADRIEPTFLILRTNARFWPRAAIPASGWRTGSPEIFQYYPGRGLQLQPLASWGRANAIAGACLAALRSRSTQGPLPAAPR